MMKYLSIEQVLAIIKSRTKKKYASDKTFKEKLEIWLLSDHKKAFKIRIFNMILKFMTCVLYIVQVILTTPPENQEVMRKNIPENSSYFNDTERIVWLNLAFVYRHPVIRYMQCILGFYGFIESVLYFYLNYKETLFSKLINPYFIVDMLCTIPWFFEITIPGAKDLFIPVFLNCWLFKRHLDCMFKHFNYLNLKNSLILQKQISLTSFLCCLVFTSLCTIQHLQRASMKRTLTLIDALYFTVITLSTVGYGDIVADYWLTKVFIALLIIVAIVLIPSKIETLASLWLEKKKSGGMYNSGNSLLKHIVVCLTYLEYDFIEHFLKEFYGHRRNQAMHTVLLSTSELNSEIKQLLNSPLWHKRVYFILGSAMREHDLERCRVTQAQAAFILSPKGLVDKDKEDQHTILRSWAIKDFAPHVPQFVQLFRTENKMHLSYVENLVCEDEFKYAILANNCLCPGISTLITLMLHKSSSEDKRKDFEPWQELYSILAGNEVHSIIASQSKFFQKYIGKPFPLVSLVTYEKYNICLVALCTKHTKLRKKSDYYASSNSFNLKSKNVLKDTDNDHSYMSNVIINPGSNYTLKPDDICIYLSSVKEQNYDWNDAKTLISTIAEMEDLSNGNLLAARRSVWDRLHSVIDLQKAYPEPTETVFLEDMPAKKATKVTFDNSEDDEEGEKSIEDHQLSIDYSRLNTTKTRRQSNKDVNDDDLIVDLPPNPSSIGTFQTKCKLLKTPKGICCLNLGVKCEHRMNVIKTSDYTWHNRCIIVYSENANRGLFNFLLPLRAKARSTKHMKPLVLLLENKPSNDFLETIASFPLISWLEGSISDLNTLLKAGILHAEVLVVVSNEKQTQIDDESLYDSSNIFAIQNINRLFPRLKIITELRKASNIRFMKFRAKDMEKDKLPKLSYMYRTPFTAGNVFSASMIDTLLYQAFGKSYIVEFVRLLIGISQSDGSGNLTSILLNEKDFDVKTYGSLYRNLIFSTGEIPIGIYRTVEKGTAKEFITQNCELKRMVLSKMDKLKMNSASYDNVAGESTVGRISYVLINPPSDFLLQQNDIIYLLKPGN